MREVNFARPRGFPGKPALVLLAVLGLCWSTISVYGTERKPFTPRQFSNHSWPTSSSSSSYRGLTQGCDPHEECIPAARCTAGGGLVGTASLRPCTTTFNTDGICCRTTSVRLRKRSQDYEHVSRNAVQQGRQEYARKLQAVERNRKVIIAEKEALPDFHRHFQHVLPPVNPVEENRVFEDIFASRRFAEVTNMTLDERQRDQFGLSRGKRCVPPVAGCDPRAPYRTFDGSCNNLQRTSWGVAGYPFEKLLPPAYEDGVWSPRIHSVTGRLLASARTISAALLPDIDRPHPFINLLFMQFGQFIAHDITRSKSVRLGQEDIDCCARGGTHALQGDQRHFACFPIEVSPNDPFFSQFGVRCLNFVRLSLAGQPECRLGYAKQVNRITHFLDGSVVYGSSLEQAQSLRSFHSGQLLNSFPLGIERLPLNRDPGFCEPWAKICFEAGDDRANQIISLVQVHTLFLREHNRVAGILAHVNPQWSDEILYQETRKIVVAELQKIVFNEYLPLVLGRDRAAQYGLHDASPGYTNLYNPGVKPVVLSEFSGTAFRFGHSTVQGAYVVRHRHAPAEVIPLEDTFNDPSRLLTPTSFDDFMYSLGAQPQQQSDHFITRSLTELLFRGRNPFGSDLAALNIQRGRDHALRPYNDYREWVGLPRIRSFEELGSVGARLAQVYESPDDIDLFIGGLVVESQTAREGLVGETFGHLIGEQFARLKFGDRFYYKNGPEINPGAFQPQQLQQIDRITLAAVICSNVDRRFDFYQAPKAFLQSNAENVPIPCEQIHGLDLRAWAAH